MNIRQYAKHNLIKVWEWLEVEELKFFKAIIIVLLKYSHNFYDPDLRFTPKEAHYLKYISQ